MRARLVAAGAGTLVIAFAALAYSLGSRPVIAGTNSVEPLYAVVAVPPDGRSCQALPSVPGGANQLLMAVDPQTQGRGKLRVKVTAGSGAIVSGIARGLRPGVFGFRLSHRTKQARRAVLCVSNPGRDLIVLSGENKRARSARGGFEPRAVPSVVFLRPHTTTLLGGVRSIARRFGNGQVGGMGTWALVVAALLAFSAWGLAVWWLVTRRGAPG